MDVIIDIIMENALWIIGGLAVVVAMVIVVIALLLRQTAEVFLPSEEEVIDTTNYENYDDQFYR